MPVSDFVLRRARRSDLKRIATKYTKSDIEVFFNAYNNFKLAVKYMKQVNKIEGKKYAKQYAKRMLEILSK
jgi:hypothetical protein